jgi:hypothetical protein
MEQWTQLSIEKGHPIRAWVLEGNSGFKALLGYGHFATWSRKWGGTVELLLHTTGLNKRDSVASVEALLPNLYRAGKKRLPYRRGDREAVWFFRATASGARAVSRRPHRRWRSR